MPHRIVLAVVAICCTVLPCQAERILVPVKTTDYTFAVWSDPHISVTDGIVFPDSLYFSCKQVLDFVQNYDPKPAFLLLGGDMCSGSWWPNSDLPWDSPYGPILDNHVNVAASALYLREWSDTTGIPLIPVAGNHEATYYSALDSVPEGTDWDPFGVARKYWAEYWPSGRHEYHATTFHSVRVLALSNNVDTLGTAVPHYSAYAPQNPPALRVADVMNPDYSGFVTPASPQWAWAVDQVANSTEIWTIPIMHRSVYGPTLYGSRPNIFRARHGIMADLIDAGVRLVFQGDIHQGAVVGPVNRNAVDPGGAYFVTTDGYMTRKQEFAAVPEHSVLYPADADGQTIQNAHVALCSVYGKRIHLKIYRVDDCYAADPLSLVFDMGVRQ